MALKHPTQLVAVVELVCPKRACFVVIAADGVAASVTALSLSMPNTPNRALNAADAGAGPWQVTVTTDMRVRQRRTVSLCLGH
jgi:hypothetical protein